VNSRLIHLQTSASDVYNQVTYVRFWVHYDGDWLDLGVDNDPTDGWGVSWDATGIPEQTIFLFTRAVIHGGTSVSGEATPFDLDYTPPTYVDSAFYPHSGIASTIFTAVAADDELSGVETIEMYFNTDRYGSDSGDWIYAGKINASQGLIQWNTRETNLTPGLHRVVFGMKDRAGNWSVSNNYLAYNFGRHIYLPLVIRNFSP